MALDAVSGLAASGIGLGDGAAFGNAAAGGLGQAAGGVSDSMAQGMAGRMVDGAQLADPSQLLGSQLPAAAGSGDGGSPSFQGVLDSLDRAEAAEKQSNALSQAFSQGADVPIHQVMAAAEEAQLTLETLTALRNKALDAMNELMRLQV